MAYVVFLVMAFLTFGKGKHIYLVLINILPSPTILPFCFPCRCDSGRSVGLPLPAGSDVTPGRHHSQETPGVRTAPPSSVIPCYITPLCCVMYRGPFGLKIW